MQIRFTQSMSEPNNHSAAGTFILDDIDVAIGFDGKVVGVNAGADDAVEQGVTSPECGVAEQYNDKRNEDFELQPKVSR